MQIAYLILAHNRPQQLAGLIAALPSDVPIFIHFDARASCFKDACSAVYRVNPRVAFVPRHACRWGDPGIMYATLELVSALVHSGLRFDYATLLSGADYPIKSHPVIARDLSGGGEFIECFPLLEPNRWSDHGGYFAASARILGRYVRFRSHIKRIGTRRLRAGVIPFGGSQWWTLSANALRYVDRVARTDFRLIRFLARSFIPDELFMQTILGNSLFAKDIVSDDLRFAIWDRPKPPYPATITRFDLAALAASDKHFARKFDFDSDRGLYAELDRLRGHPQIEIAVTSDGARA